MRPDLPMARQPGAMAFGRRLVSSPLRDVLRGRPTGRLNWKHLVATSELPDELQALVIEVTRRTRLTGLERSDIARELITHFQDGLDRDESVESLARSFGDATQAARLIGRAKKRTRPPLVRAAVRSLQVLGATLALAVVLYVVSAVQFFLARPSPSVDYLLQINARALALPEADRAWPRYRQALLALPDAPDFKERSNRPPRPGEPGWSEIKSYLVANAGHVASVREAASMPGLGFLPGYEFSDADLELWPDLEGFSEKDIEEGSLMAVLLPHLAELRSLARLLQNDLLRAASQGDGATALADVEAMLGIATQTRETTFIINDLVALSVFQLMTETLGDVLATYPETFDETQLQVLAHRLAAHDRQSMGARYSVERLGFRDVVQRMYTDDGDGDGHLTAQGTRLLLNLAAGGDPLIGERSVSIMALGPALRGFMPSRREMIEQYDAYIDAAEAYAALPPWQREATTLESTVEQWNQSLITRVRYLPMIALAPALSKAADHTDRVMQHRDAVLVALALELHHRRTGTWPATLDEITPLLLPTTPLDRFDGAPLRYTLNTDGPRLYSVGVDRDDDGGRHHPSAHQEMGVSTPRVQRYGPDALHLPDGDDVLWPRPVETLEVFASDTLK